MAEEYGFQINMKGDAAEKLNELLKKFNDTAGAAKKTHDETGHFGKMLGAITLGGLAEKGAEKIFESIKDEIMESEKASIEYDKALKMMKFSFQDLGEESYKSIETLAEGSKLFTPTQLLEASSTLHRVGGLAISDIEEMLPLIEDFSRISGQDLPSSIMAMSSGLQTGTVRSKELKAAIASLKDPVTGLSVNFKSASLVERYGYLIQALGKYAGGSAADLKTMSGELDAMNAKKAKIQEMHGSNFFTKVWSSISLGFTEIMNDSATQIVEGKDKIEEVLSSSKGTGKITTVLKEYNDQLAKYNAAVQRVKTADFSQSVAAKTDLDIQESILKYVSERFNITMETLKASKGIKEVTEETGSSYSKISKSLTTMADKMKDEIVNKKNVSEEEKKAYLTAYGKTKQADMYIANLNKSVDKYYDAVKKSSLTTSDLAGAAGGLGQAKVININFNSGSAVQKIEVDSAKAGKAIESNADNAIAVLIRTVNNLSYTQAGTM